MNQRMRHQITTIVAMFAEYPATELVYTTPFQCLLAVLLSAQTTDKQVNKVTTTFFQSVKYPADLRERSMDKIRTAISWVNYANSKAKHIHQTAHLLYDQYDGVIPDRLEALITLPGVGIKTAKVVLQLLYGQPYIAVDTHVHRVAHRLGRVKDLTHEQTSIALEKKVSKDLIDDFHKSVIYFWRYHCTARNPKCASCPLQEGCKWYKKLPQ